MGCGPSKDANVATSNMVSKKSLQKKNSATSSSTTTTTTTNNNNTEDTNPKAGSVEENGKLSEDVKLEDVVPTAPSAPEAEDKGKFIAAGSPDRYFSSRKGEEAVEVVTPSGYVSPPSEIADEDKAEVAEADEEKVNANGEESASEITVSGGNDGVVVVPKQEEGETSSKESDDLKEAILVEEKESATTNVDEQKNVAEEGKSGLIDVNLS